MSVTAAQGFEAVGIHCGLRASSPDLAVVRSLAPATGAALFTANRVQAAPVRERIDEQTPVGVYRDHQVPGAALEQRVAMPRRNGQPALNVQI